MSKDQKLLLHYSLQLQQFVVFSDSSQRRCLKKYEPIIVFNNSNK